MPTRPLPNIRHKHCWLNLPKNIKYIDKYTHNFCLWAVFMVTVYTLTNQKIDNMKTLDLKLKYKTTNSYLDAQFSSMVASKTAYLPDS